MNTRQMVQLICSMIRWKACWDFSESAEIEEKNTFGISSWHRGIPEMLLPLIAWCAEKTCSDFSGSGKIEEALLYIWPDTYKSRGIHGIRLVYFWAHTYLTKRDIGLSFLISVEKREKRKQQNNITLVVLRDFVDSQLDCIYIAK